jgi:hypothetical protein
MSNIKAIVLSRSEQESYHRGQQAAIQVGQCAKKKTMTSNFYLDFDNCIVRVLNPVVDGEKLESTQNGRKIFRTQELELSRL